MKLKLTIFTIILLHTVCCFSQKIIKSSTEMNTALTSEIGDAVFSVSEIIQTKAIVVTETYTQKSGIMKFHHIEGNKYPFQFTKKGFDFYYLKENRKDGRYWGVAINSENNSEIYAALVSLANIPKVVKKHSLMTNIEKSEIISTCDKCYRQELIYNGKSGHTLKFTYREYIDNLARPSFFQDLEYDIEESNIIGFKGLRMEVLNTSNITINYIILQGFKID